MMNIQSISWVATTVVGGTLGAPFVMKATRSWYRTIPLPSFTPPNAIFGPVWSLLYATMGIASWRIRNIVLLKQTIHQSSKNIGVTGAGVGVGVGGGLLSSIQQHIMILSLIHYTLNIIWAPIFFGLKRFRLGHVLNITIWATLIPIIIGYSTLDLVSGLMLIPYFLWLSFAIRLSDGICKLNPTDAVKNGRLFNNAKLEDEIWKLRKEAGERVGL